MDKFVSALCGLAAMAAGFLAGQADAANASRDKLSHGSANCQSALPAFDVNLRKRPQGIRNLGPGSSFITCDSESIDNAPPLGATRVGIYFTNVSGANGVSVDCTLVNGFFAGNTFTFLPKTSTAMGVGDIGSVSWTPVDNGGTSYSAAAVSCLLPPGVEISVVQYVYPEDIGS